MKNTKISFLLFMVIAIWGVIVYQVSSKMFGEYEQIQFSPRKIMKVMEKPEYALSFSYDDPFLKDVERKAEVERPIIRPIQATSRPAINSIAPVLIDWSNVKYFGMIQNATKKSKTATIKIGDVEYFARVGEVIDAFTVFAIERDSVGLKSYGDIRYIKKSSN